MLVDPETGQAVATHSGIKTFRRCPKQAQWKYVARLKPRTTEKPLKRGTWIHKLLEVHYKGGDWRAEHQRLSLKFNDLFDEEKDEYGDLPREIYAVMKAYFWHYKADPWKILEAEFILETEFPDGSLYRGKVDLLIENQYGLWIVDHKSHKSLPNLDFRMLDAQSALYVWAALRNKIKVQGHIWNYIKYKAPGKPVLLKDGSRLSKVALDTDYPTYKAALKEYGLDPEPYKPELARLKRARYQPGEPQTSAFFRRDVLEKSNAMLKRVATEAFHTARRMHEYDFSDEEAVERVPDRSCTFTCSYTDICSLQLFGADISRLIKQRYVAGDPLSYYNDEDGKWIDKGDGE